MRAHVAFAAGSLAVFAGALAFALAGSPELPDRSVSPGLVASTDVNEICGREGGLTYSQRHRQTTREMKNAVLAEYGLHGPFRGEIDHIVPLCLGGADDVRNLWPQQSFHQKDALEAYACRMVCAGKVAIGEAQSWFRGDFTKQYYRAAP